MDPPWSSTACSPPPATAQQALHTAQTAANGPKHSHVQANQPGPHTAKNAANGLEHTRVQAAGLGPQSLPHAPQPRQPPAQQQLGQEVDFLNCIQGVKVLFVYLNGCGPAPQDIGAILLMMLVVVVLVLLLLLLQDRARPLAPAADAGCGTATIACVDLLGGARRHRPSTTPPTWMHRPPPPAASGMGAKWADRDSGGGSGGGSGGDNGTHSGGDQAGRSQLGGLAEPLWQRGQTATSTVLGAAEVAGEPENGRRLSSSTLADFPAVGGVGPYMRRDSAALRPDH